MAKFCLNTLEMALRLANHDRTYEDIAVLRGGRASRAHRLFLLDARGRRPARAQASDDTV
jgi:hypothetical protein